MTHDINAHQITGLAGPDTPIPEVVPGPIEVTDESTTWSLGTLGAAALADIQATFEKMHHAPSAETWTALTAILSTMEAMANGTAEPLIYVSSTDPGNGKTQAMMAFMRALLASPDHDGVSALVCIERLDEIEKLAAESGLPADSFAAFTAEKNEKINALGCGDPGRARILFTTHAMLERRCDGRPFAGVSSFHYHGRPRDLRIYDEAILPGRTLTVSSDSIAALLGPMRRVRPALANDLDMLRDVLKNVDDRTQCLIPDLAAEHNLDISDALRAVQGERLTATVDQLWRLFGKVVSVRRDGATNTFLEYSETLSPDIAPLLVLDASARVRATYELWGARRGGLKLLPGASKDYSPMTVHVWAEGGGKSSFRSKGARYVEGTAQLISSKPNERWLVIYHLNVGRNIPKEVRALVPPHTDVAFLNWGRHNATNAFKDYPNVILCGTLFLPDPHIEALTRLAAAHPSSEGHVSDLDFNEVARGEQRHAILQAVCRSKARQCDGPRCHPTNAYIIASPRSGIARELPRVLPGCRVAPWQPFTTSPKGKAGAALGFIVKSLAEGAAEVPFAEVKGFVGVANAANFAKTVRKKIAAALEAEGIIEWPKVRPTGYVRASAAYFGDVKE